MEAEDKGQCFLIIVVSRKEKKRERTKKRKEEKKERREEGKEKKEEEDKMGGGCRGPEQETETKFFLSPKSLNNVKIAYIRDAKNRNF